MAGPSETDYGDAVNEGAIPAGRAEAGDSAERSAASPGDSPPRRESAGVRGHAAQDGQPDAPATQEEPGEGDVLEDDRRRP